MIDLNGTDSIAVLFFLILQSVLFICQQDAVEFDLWAFHLVGRWFGPYHVFSSFAVQWFEDNMKFPLVRISFVCKNYFLCFSCL